MSCCSAVAYPAVLVCLFQPGTALSSCMTVGEAVSGARAYYTYLVECEINAVLFALSRTMTLVYTMISTAVMQIPCCCVLGSTQWYCRGAVWLQGRTALLRDKQYSCPQQLCSAVC